MVQDAVPQLIHMCHYFATTITVTLADQINFFSSFSDGPRIKKGSLFSTYARPYAFFVSCLVSEGPFIFCQM